MATTVLAQVLRKGSYDYECSGGSVHKESIPCESATVDGIYWRVPMLKAGVHVGYEYRMWPTKPTLDAVKTLRVTAHSTGKQYYIAIGDAQDATVFTDLCNACCDTDTEMATISLPAVVIEEESCVVDANGSLLYSAYVLETPPTGGRYYLAGSVNGAALATPPVAGFATLADLKTWADANWNTNGATGVTIEGKKVTLKAGPNAESGSISVTLGQFFESNTPGSLTTGQNYSLAATVNGNVLPVVASADNAPLTDLAAAANASAAHYALGVWTEAAGKIRLTKSGATLTSATLTVSKV